MDRNNAVGLIIILFILLGWSYWMSNQNLKRAAAQKKIQDSIALTIPTETPTQDSTPPTVAADPDSIRRAQDHALYGNLADYMHGTEEVVTLENNLIKIDFNTKGGFISKAELKEYQREFEDQEHKRQSGPLYLLDNPQNKFGYTIPWGNTANGKIVTSDFFFSYNREGNALVFRLPFGEGSYFEQRYTLQPDSYILDYSVKLVGLPGSTGTQQVQLNWENYLDKIEINDSFERFYSTNYYKEVDEDPNYCSCRSNDTKTFENKPLKWISNSNQFFNTSIIAETSFPDAVLSTEMLDKEAAALKKLTTQLSVPLQGTDAFQMKMYVGPNEFKRLRAMGYQMEDIIPFGRSVFGTINRWVFRPLFGWLLKYIGSAGIVILILTLLVKAALFPLTYQSLHSQIKMSALKPYIASLKDKFKDDQQQQQMETMKLYREFGVNPLGGCLPMVLQMPVWFALYRFFPASIEFRQESFLWAHDLSSYDVFFRLPFELPVVGAHISLFTILWAGSTLAYTYYNSKMMDMSNVNPAMKYVQYLMPLMFTVYFNNYASGLTCYLLFSNLLNIGQTLGAKRFLFDESKILEKLEANKKKPKKKSGFQARLEEALKEQQRQAAQKQSPKKEIISMAWQGIVFDLDGTLVDTEPLHRDAWLDTLSTYHLNYDEAWFSQWIGQSDRTLASWVVANALHQMDEETLLESKRKKYYRLASEYTPLFRGVGEALPILASKYALAIATNSSNEDAEAVFLSTRIEPYFKAIVTSNKVAHMKPAPDPYLQAASLLQIDPKKLIAVEDSPAGITAARQAGLYTLGVTNSHPEDKLKEADKIFPSTQDALIWITR